MNYLLRLFALTLLLVGCIALIHLSTQNKQLGAELKRLEAELGRMSIDDVNKVHLVEIEKPDIPPEVATHVVKVWQFRCYMPAGYGVVRLNGDGRVTEEGIYHEGGYGSTSSSPQREATHQLLTVSLQKKGSRLNASFSLAGAGMSTSWNRLSPESADKWVIQKLVSSDHGPRSFSQDTILPLLKIYDPNTPENETVAGKKLTTYQGGVLILCPTTREAAMNQLRLGKTPSDFEPNWLATELVDE
jgi:hypothetical protein